MRRPRYTVLAAAISASALIVSGCSSDHDSLTAARPVGGATPQASVGEAHPDGTVHALPDSLSEASSLAVSGEYIAVKSGNSLGLGTRDDFLNDHVKSLELHGECGDVSASSVSGQATFVLACTTDAGSDNAAGTVYTIDAAASSPEITEFATHPGHSLTTATQLSTGEVIAGQPDKDSVLVFPHANADSNDVNEVAIAEPADVVASVPFTDHADSVAMINRRVTTIQGLDRVGSKPRQGARLRSGMGVGRIAPGEEGMFVASDTLGGQVLIYTRHDVIRLQQSGVTDPSPWAVAWDSPRRLAWVSSTVANTLVGYDISTGEPVEARRLNTVPNVRGIGVLEDGAIVTVSSSGEGIQFIDAI